MKNLLTSLFFTALLLCISCNLLEEDEPATELEKLPPLTQTGENTFGCLVNGEALVVKNTYYLVAIFQQGQLQFGGSTQTKYVDQGITFILGDPLEISLRYDFPDGNYNARFYKSTIDNVNCYYEFEDTFEGSVQFSNIDRIDFIISGTFEFSTVTDDCDTIHITDGRFDMHYIP